MDQEIEKQVSSQRAYDGHFLKINRDQVILPDGQLCTREYIVHPGASMIIPMREDGMVMVERQFRYPLHRYFIEFPAGKLDLNESPLKCAKRELLEETGYIADDHNWHYLTNIHNAIAYADEVIHLFLANNVTDTGVKSPEESEVWLTTEWMSPKALLDLVQLGEISDVKTVIGIFWLNNFMNNRNS